MVVVDAVRRVDESSALLDGHVVTEKAGFRVYTGVSDAWEGDRHASLALDETQSTRPFLTDDFALAGQTTLPKRMLARVQVLLALPLYDFGSILV